MWGLFPSKRVKSSTDQCKRPLHSVPCSQSHNVIMNAVCLVEEIINTRRMSAPLFSSQGWRFYKDFKFILFNVRNHYASVQWRKQLQQSNQKLFSSNSFKWLLNSLLKHFLLQVPFLSLSKKLTVITRSFPLHFSGTCMLPAKVLSLLLILLVKGCVNDPK